MIRRVDIALRAELAAAPIDRSLALFEAAMMARCALLPTENAGRGRAPAPSLPVAGEWREPGVLIELASGAAAQRYMAAVAVLTPEAQVRGRQLGWRHLYEVHQVTVPARLEPMVVNRLRRAWQAGSELLADNRQPIQALRREAAARAAWRAALLVVGPGRGIACVRLRLADMRAVDLLMHASAVLGLPGRAQRRPGGHVVSVDGPDAVRRLLDEAGCVSRLAAEAVGSVERTSA